MCYSACLSQNLLNSKNFHFVLFVQIKRDPPVVWDWWMCSLCQPHPTEGHKARLWVSSVIAVGLRVTQILGMSTQASPSSLHICGPSLEFNSWRRLHSSETDQPLIWLLWMIRGLSGFKNSTSDRLTDWSWNVTHLEPLYCTLFAMTLKRVSLKSENTQRTLASVRVQTQLILLRDTEPELLDWGDLSLLCFSTKCPYVPFPLNDERTSRFLVCSAWGFCGRPPECVLFVSFICFHRWRWLVAALASIWGVVCFVPSIMRNTCVL